MSNLEPLLERNQAFAANGGHEGLTPLPTHMLFLVTCIDGRVDPAHVLGADLGDALVLRNAGGRVNDEVINEIVFIAALTEEILGDDAVDRLNELDLFSIGPVTSRTAERLGLRVTATSQAQTIESLVEAARAYYARGADADA